MAHWRRHASLSLSPRARERSLKGKPSSCVSTDGTRPRVHPAPSAEHDDASFGSDGPSRRAAAEVHGYADDGPHAPLSQGQRLLSEFPGGSVDDLEDQRRAGGGASIYFGKEHMLKIEFAVSGVDMNSCRIVLQVVRFVLEGAKERGANIWITVDNEAVCVQINDLINGK